MKELKSITLPPLIFISLFVLSSCTPQDDDPDIMMEVYPLSFVYSTYVVESQTFYYVGSEDLVETNASTEFQQHIDQFLIQDLLPGLSADFTLQEMTLTSDTTFTAVNYNSSTQTNTESTGEYTRDGNRLLFSDSNSPFAPYLILSADESELYWCEYYFTRTRFNQGSGETQFGGFEQFPCFFLDDSDPIMDYRMNYSTLIEGDTLGVIQVNQVLTLQE